MGWAPCALEALGSRSELPRILRQSYDEESRTHNEPGQLVHYAQHVRRRPSRW